MFGNIKYLITTLYSYRKLLFRVIIFELYYSIKNFEIIPNIKLQNSNFGTDTIPCIYYFLFKISQFIKKNKIKSVIDLGAGYGKVTNFIYVENKIKVQGIEIDRYVFKKSLLLKKSGVQLHCANILRFNLSNLKSQCFILVDPLKKRKDKKKLISKILKLKKNKKKVSIVSINMDKKFFPKKIRLLEKYTGSESKSLRFFEIN